MMINLDRTAAYYAQQMVNSCHGTEQIKTLERLITKALGVLQSQGVYALMLFLYSRSSDEEKVAPCIYNALFRLLKDENRDHYLPAFADKKVPRQGSNARFALKFYIESVSSELPTLLLVRDLYEQTLIYARYHAKALS